jgi:hypothetical protein
MEPNQSANSNPTHDANASGAGQSGNNSQPSGADNQGAASQGSSAGQQSSSDGKNWMDVANLQKLVDQLPQGVKDFFTNSWSQVGKSAGQVGGQFNKLTTTQKVAGVAALAGIGYLALRSGKSSEKSYGKSYRGGSKKGKQSYRSGSGHYSSSGQGQDDSHRMDRGPGNYASFDRQNETRSGGSYQPNSGGSSSSYGSGDDYSSGSANTGSGSSISDRSTGYRGTSGNFTNSDGSDFGSGV